MLEVMSGWLVQQPGHIALVAAGNLAVWALCRATVLRAAQGYNRLWVPAVLWLAYAAWEWLVLVRTPEANIRVDLLLIWPVIALTTLWALGRAAMGWWKTRHR